jgi:hypothetical protein
MEEAMRRTTIFADDAQLREMQLIAEREGKTLSELLREAINLLVSKRRGKKGAAPSFAGMAKSGKSDVSERHEQLLWREKSE